METARVSECHRALTSWHGIIPNNSRDIFSQMFMNSSFTYSGAYPSIENYANLYNEGSQWAQVFVKGIYANVVVGGINMYWVLSFLPSLLEILICVIKPFEINFIVLLVWILCIIPMWLLFVNLYYIKNVKISYLRSILYIILVNILRTYIYIFAFSDDTPIDLFLIFFIVSVSIIFLGMIIVYFICRILKRNKK